MSAEGTLSQAQPTSGIYILHFDEPLDYERYGGLLHYVGRSDVINWRLTQHDRGKGSAKTKLAHSLGIGWSVTVLNPDDIEPDNLNEAMVTEHPEIYCGVCLLTPKPPLIP